VCFAAAASPRPNRTDFDWGRKAPECPCPLVSPLRLQPRSGSRRAAACTPPTPNRPSTANAAKWATLPVVLCQPVRAPSPMKMTYICTSKSRDIPVEAEAKRAHMVAVATDRGRPKLRLVTDLAQRLRLLRRRLLGGHPQPPVPSTSSGQAPGGALCPPASDSHELRVWRSHTASSQ
jgi:hypothetical protein